MTEEVNICLDEAKDQMERSITHLQQEMARVRAGKANPAMLDGIMVDYYGNDTPIKQVANVNNLDVKTLVITPWEKSMLEPVERAIIAANIGVTPQNDGNVIRLIMPPLTEERRKELVKKVKELAESSKISVRNARKEANDMMKSLTKDGLSEDLARKGEDKVQDLTNAYIEKVDKYLHAKEEEIMTV